MPLSIQVGGETSGFEQAMAKAQAVARVTGQEIARRFDGAAEDSIKSLAKIGASAGLRALGPGLLIGGAVLASWAVLSAVIKSTAEEIQRLVELQGQAGRADVSAPFAEGLLKSTRETRLEAEGLAQALKTAGDAVALRFAQTPPALDTMTQLFGEFSEQVRKFMEAPTAQGRILVALEQVRELERIGQRLAAQELGSKLLGPEFAQNLREGRVNLDGLISRMQDAARAQDDTAQRAADLAQRLSDARSRLDEFTAVSFSLKEPWLAVQNTIVNINEGIANAITATRKWAASLPASVRGGLGIGGGAEIEGLSAPGATPLGSAARGPEQIALERLRSGLQSRALIEAAQKSSEATEKQVRPELPKKQTGGGGVTRAESLDDVERLILAMEKSNAVLQAEFENLGKGNVERGKAVALAKLHAEAKEAGREATEEEIANTLKLAEANAQLKTKIEAAREAQQEFREVSSALSDAFKDAVLHGKSLSDVFSTLADRLASRSIDKLFDSILVGSPAAGGGGLLGSLFNSLPKFAEGGIVPGSGPVPIMAHGGEVVIPKAAVSNATTASGPQNLNITVDVRGATGNQEVQAMVAAGVRQGLTAVPRIAQQVVRDRGRAW